MEPTLAKHIELKSNRRGIQKAYISGTRVRVQDIVSDYERHGRTPEEIAREYPHISLAQVHAALAYYFDNREEIRRQMKADEQFVKQAMAEGEAAPHAKGTDTQSDSVSS